MNPDLYHALLALGVLGALVAALAHAWVAVRAWWTASKRRIRVAGVLLPFVLIGGWIVGLPVPGWVAVAAAVVAGLLVWRRTSTTAATVTRWSERTRRKSGVASTLDVMRHASTWAMRRTAAVVRPSLADLPRSEYWKVPTSAFATLLVRAGWQKVWASVEDVVVVFGGPRMGKSGWLAAQIVDAPGACLIASTRADLYEHTAHLREGPVFVFNAVGLAGLASTLTFDPLTGCEDPVTAHARASDLLPLDGDASGERAYWNMLGQQALAMFLHAAALGGRSMRDVLRWVSAPEKAEREVASLLRMGGTDSEASCLAALQLINMNDRTRTSITSTITPALRWLTSPPAAAAARGGGWTVEEFLDTRATIYLLGAHETQSEPLVAALVGHIAREARRIAGRGRLDPPLGLYVDEATRMAPDALVDWSADMGGNGGSIIALFQSRAQMLARWGRDKTATVLNNAGAIMLFGGTTDRDDLEFWSTLGGERDEPVPTTDPHGRVKTASTRKVRVLQQSEIRKLPPKRAIVYRRGLAPAVGRARMVWEPADIREAVAGWWNSLVTRFRVVTPAPAVPAEVLAEPIPLRPPVAAQDEGDVVA